MSKQDDDRVMEHFHCDCNGLGCQIMVELDEDEHFFSLYVWIGPHYRRWSDRLNWAWRALRGDTAGPAEVILTNREAYRFVEHVASLVHNDATR